MRVTRVEAVGDIPSHLSVTSRKEVLLLFIICACVVSALKSTKGMVDKESEWESPFVKFHGMGATAIVRSQRASIQRDAGSAAASSAG